MMSSHFSYHRQKGMTLVEVLVAFAIMSGVVVSAMTLVSQNTRYMIYAEERLLAQIAADNLMAEAMAKRATPGTGQRDGTILIGDREFEYTVSAIEIGDRLIQIEYQVRREGNVQTLARANAVRERL